MNDAILLLIPAIGIGALAGGLAMAAVQGLLLLNRIATALEAMVDEEKDDEVA